MLTKITSVLYSGLETLPVDVEDLAQDKRAEKFLESSEFIIKKICKAREIQQKIFRKRNIYSNAEMSNKGIKKYYVLNSEVENIFNQVAIAFQFSARSYSKIIKITRMITNLQRKSSNSFLGDWSIMKIYDIIEIIKQVIFNKEGYKYSLLLFESTTLNPLDRMTQKKYA